MAKRHIEPAWVLDVVALKAALHVAGVSPYSLQASAGVDHGVMYRLLDGTTVNPLASTLLSIAEALGVDPRSLMARQW